MDRFQQEEDTTLDNALDQLPLAALPPGFSERVMEAIGQKAPAVRFRLHLLDVVLALATSMILAAVWLAILWWSGIISPDWLAMDSLSFKISHQLPWGSPTLLLGGAMLLILEMGLLTLIALNVLGDRVHSS